MPAMIHPKSLPMLVEPRKWESHDIGGYLTHKSGLYRIVQHRSADSDRYDHAGKGLP